MSTTTYLDTLVLDKTLRGENFVLTATLYTALFTGDPGKAGSLATEITAPEYARVATTFATDWTNLANIIFPSATSGWGLVTRVGLCTNPTGNFLIAYGTVTSFQVNSGDVVRIDTPNMSVTM